MHIIGISFGYHDSACCLLRDGRIVAAAQEERFSRTKNDRAFPASAFNYCMKAAAITIADIDCMAFYEDPSLKLGRQIWMGMLPGSTLDRRTMVQDLALWTRPEDEIRRLTGFAGPLEIVDHHLSHAASAYYFSGFEEAAIFTVDGVGEWATTTYNSASGIDITRLGSVDFPDSLGLFYSTITGYLGFEVNEGEYKVMGLAPYGQPRYVKQIRKLIDEGVDGKYSLNLKYFSFLEADKMYSEELVELLGASPRAAESDITQFHKDVARSVQFVLEDVLLTKVRYLHSTAPSENLCMAGGVALNVVANARCLHEGPFKRLFVQPAAGDAGGCLGAAAIAHVRHTGDRPHRERLRHVFLGPSNELEDISYLLQSSGATFRDFRGDETGLIEHVVDRLVEGEVVGWVSGRMEFGPRSLGARSILADPRRPEMRNRINALIKQREEFRPFAPVVLDRFAAQHFALDHSSPFMLETCQVISPVPLPAVTHVDGSARVQTITSEECPRLAALLEGFHARTGCPILLNTSFNLRGEPIVCSATDAIGTFGSSQIDALILEDFVLDRSAIPAQWENLSRPSAVSAQNYAVYTMF